MHIKIIHANFTHTPVKKNHIKAQRHLLKTIILFYFFIFAYKCSNIQT